MERLFIEETSTIYVGMPHSRKWSESGNLVLCQEKVQTKRVQLPCLTS